MLLFCMTYLNLQTSPVYWTFSQRLFDFSSQENLSNGHVNLMGLKNSSPMMLNPDQMKERF